MYKTAQCSALDRASGHWSLRRPTASCMANRHRCVTGCAGFTCMQVCMCTRVRQLVSHAQIRYRWWLQMQVTAHKESPLRGFLVVEVDYMAAEARTKP
jgi:hypothetical protein